MKFRKKKCSGEIRCDVTVRFPLVNFRYHSIISRSNIHNDIYFNSLPRHATPRHPTHSHTTDHFHNSGTWSVSYNFKHSGFTIVAEGVTL